MSKQMSRRQFLRGGAFVMAGVTLAACVPQAAPAPASGGGEAAAEQQPAAAPAAAEVVKMKYYDRTTDAPRWADAYNESHDKIQVEVEIQPPNTRYEQLVAAVTAGNSPDVIGLDCVQVGRFAQINALATLEDLIPPETQKLYFESMINVERHYGRANGHIVGVPFWVDNSVCYYNKKMLQDVGGDPEKGFESWDDHVQYGKEAMKNDIFGFATGQVNSFLFGPWVWAAGGDWTDAEWTKSRCDEKPVGDMLQFARDIQNTYKITNDAVATDWGTMGDLFTSQKAMAVYGGGGNVGLIRREFPELFEVLGTCPIPGPEKGQISSFIGGNVASISAVTKVKEAALDFLIWATAGDGMAVTGEIGYLPGCPAGMELPTYQKDWGLYKAFKDALTFGYPAANDPRFDEVQLTPPNTAWSEALMNEKPISEIQQVLHDTINSILARR